MPTSLRYFNLSENTLKDDINVSSERNRKLLLGFFFLLDIGDKFYGDLKIPTQTLLLHVYFIITESMQFPGTT